ncbi:flagellar export chaperone FliS [Aquipuribacter hungaricus]|uniref:Flagellar export chaperone FliS n=1 Tax=Aquipuribacter hungaricus TaxID=545624 RepID=A0ABV7WI27_9MICO
MSAATFGFATARPTTSAARNRFATQSLETATPAQLLVRLYERLQLDIARAEAEQRAGRHTAASEQLVHAQAIVSELMSMLDVDAWSGAPQLLSIYTFLFSELVAANLSHDPAKTSSCGRIVAPLADAWRQAATGGTTPVAAATPVGSLGTDVPAPRASFVG